MLRESELLPIIGAEPAIWNRAGRHYFVATTAAIIAGSIAAAGAVGSAAIQAHGAKSAANTLQGAGQLAADKIDTATGQAVDYGKQGMADANTALDTGIDKQTQAIETGRTLGNADLTGGLTAGNAALQQGYDQTRTDLNPYLNLGQQGVKGLSALMDPTKAQQALTLDPGYQFRMNEALKALQNTASGRGAALGGGAAKALTRYSSDYASNEYQKVFDRYGSLANYGQHATDQAVNANMHLGDRLSANQMDAAAHMSNNDFQGGALTSQAYNDWSRLKSATAMSGNQYLGNTTLGGAEAAGNNLVGAANGAAAGQVASANAWGNAFSGTANNLSQLYMLNQLGKTPGVSGIPGLDTTIATQPAKP